MVYIPNDETLRELRKVSIDSDGVIYVDKEALTKDRFINFRHLLFTKLSDFGFHPQEFKELSSSNDSDYVIMRDLNMLYNRKPGSIIEILLGPDEQSTIDYYATADNDEKRVLLNIDNTAWSLRQAICDRGVESVYAQSKMGEGFIPITDIAEVEAGRVLTSRVDEDDPDGEYKCIYTVHMQYPVITSDMGLYMFPYPKRTYLKRGSLIVLSQTRNREEFCKPSLITHEMIDTCVSAKLFAVMMKKEDFDYSLYLFDFFSDSQNTFKQTTNFNTQITINQFRNLYVPTKEWCMRKYELDRDKYDQLEELSLQVAVGEKAKLEINRLLVSYHQKKNQQ